MYYRIDYMLHAVATLTFNRITPIPSLYRPSFVRLGELSSVAVANRQPHLSVYCPPIDLILRTGSSVDTSKLAS